MSRLQSWDYPLGAGEQLECVQDFGVRGRPVARPADLAKVSVLWPDAGVVEACRDRFSLEDLAELVLEKVRPHTVQDPWDASRPHRSAAGCFDADKARRGADKPGERTSSVAAPADAGDHEIRGAAQQLLALQASFLANYRLELAHHPGERVGAHHRPDAIVRRLDGCHPVPQRLVDGVFQCAAARADATDLGAQQSHPKDIELLAFHVDFAHINNAFQPEQGGRGRRRHAMLAGASLGNEARFAHFKCQEPLANNVVYLVATGVVEIFSLQQDSDTEAF